MRLILILSILLSSILLKAQTKSDFLFFTNASFYRENIELRSPFSTLEREIIKQKFNLGLAYSFKDSWLIGVQAFVDKGNKNIP